MAQKTLGVMYFNGQGVAKNDVEAAKWWRKAAERGFDHAQLSLGMLYRNGYGVPQDYSEAVKWYRKAAEQGLSRAQYDLGLMYTEGRGVEADLILAYFWFSLALSNQDAPASARAEVTNDRRAVANKMTPAQIGEADRLARQWKPK